MRRIASMLPLVALVLGARSARGQAGPIAADVAVQLSEWTIVVPATAVHPGPTRFIVANTGSVPHGIEVEGEGIEKRIALIQPGTTDTLPVTLKSGRYELYCPVGAGSHKRLGMVTHIVVGSGSTAAEADVTPYRTQSIHLASGGQAIQILPGPFPFADSAAATIAQFGNEQGTLLAQEKSGPFSNNVARITGAFGTNAWDLGATRDSVAGTASFTSQDGARWRLVMDRVQTKDVPHHPRFGGVIFGLYYHGNTTVHTPLVPTITSAVALWSIAHLYRNDALVTDNAMVHVMLVSRTRRSSDFALQCWDCSKNPVEELQLQITPAAGDPPFNAPGGVLYINWEHAFGTRPAR